MQPDALDIPLTVFLSMSHLGGQQEQTSRLLQFTHYYTADHVLNTFYTLLFAVSWWNSPHDGVRILNSDAQRDMVKLAQSRGEIGGQELSKEELARMAMQLWGKEKLMAVLVLLVCWVVKVSRPGRQEGYEGLAVVQTLECLMGGRQEG